MNSGKYYIPKYLDEPFRIVIFTLDEFIITMAPLIIIWILFNELLGLAAGTFFYFFYLKLKRRESSAYFKRKLYWSYGIKKYMKIMPNSNANKLKG